MALKEIRCFSFKYGMLWIGWILVTKEERAIPYFSDVKYVVIEPSVNIRYLTIGLFEKSIMKRLKKKAIKFQEEYTKGEK